MDGERKKGSLPSFPSSKDPSFPSLPLFFFLFFNFSPFVQGNGNKVRERRRVGRGGRRWAQEGRKRKLLIGSLGRTESGRKKEKGGGGTQKRRRRKGRLFRLTKSTGKKRERRGRTPPSWLRLRESNAAKKLTNSEKRR